MIAKNIKQSRNIMFRAIGGDTIKQPDYKEPPELQRPKV